MTNERESHDQTNDRDNKLPGANAGTNLNPSGNINPNSTDKIKKASGAPKPAEIIIFSCLIFAFLALLSWHSSRDFLDHHSGSVTAIATLAIMILTAFYVVYARSQWEAAHKNAEAAVKSADAAKDSAETALVNARALINAERPWLFIEIKTTAPPDTLPGEIPKYMGFSVAFKNWGKTPAEVVGFDQHPDCRNDLNDLPIPPRYSLEDHVMVHTRMVPPGEKWMHPGESYFNPSLFLLDDWEKVRRSQKRFIYWGRIQYRDLIEEPKSIHEVKRDKPITIHETCFCYFWSPPLNEFLIIGPLGYNKHT